MFRYLARRHDRIQVSRSLQRQKNISHRVLGFAHEASLAFAIDEAEASGVDRDLDFTQLEEAERFFAPIMHAVPITQDERSVTFESDIKTSDAKNNGFECVITDSGSKDHALVVFHHWYARNRYSTFAKFFAVRGITVIEATLPYHFDRAMDDYSEEKFFNASLGRTVRSMRQAVLDGRKIVRWLDDQGYKKVSVVGMCLGGTVAGLIAAHENKVDKAVLMVAPASPAELVWTAETMQSLRKRIQSSISFDGLEREWSLINLNMHQWFLTRERLDMMFVLGKDDTIARPENSNRVIDGLTKCGKPPQVVRLNCGHSSVGIFPYNIIAARNVSKFLNNTRTLSEL
ncbi:MAG: abhydrolase domain-containing 18 [Alphaproteobacteria bacterium]|nr:MAG: abhydrolase domain-containing 18 [Alphaproteobacteria bacterium]